MSSARWARCPHFADEEKDVTAEEIVALTRHPKVVGIGEAGLDRLLGSADWTNQINVFAAHLEAVQETQLPLVIHSVKEDEAMAAMLREASRKAPFPFVVHAFSGGPLLVEAALELGGYFGFGGLMTYDGNDHIRQAARDVPRDRILLETDSPSMCPAPLQAERNEPANLIKIADLLARLRGKASTRSPATPRTTSSASFPRSRNPRRLTPERATAPDGNVIGDKGGRIGKGNWSG